MSLLDVKFIRMLTAYWKINNSPTQLVTIAEDGSFEVSDLSAVGGNFIKIDPSPATEQTFIGDLNTRGVFEAFSISGSKTELTSQGIRFTFTGSSFFGVLSPTTAFTANRAITLQDKDGVIAYLSDISELSADVIHTTGDEVKNGNLQILKNAGEGTARLWVQSENGIASLRLQNGTNSAQAGAVYQDTSGNLVVQNARPGGWLDLTVTEPGGITSSAIKATPISQDVSAIELSGRVKIFDGVDNDEAVSIGQLATKANLTGGNSFTGDQNVNGNVIFPNNKGIGFSGQIAMLYDSGVSAFRVFYAQTGDDVFTINPTTQETTFIKPLVVPNAVNTEEAVNLGQLNSLGDNAVLKTGESIQTVEGAILATVSISAPLMGGEQLEIEGTGRIAGETTFEGGFKSKDASLAVTAMLNPDGDLTVAGYISIGEMLPTAGNQAVRRDYIDARGIENLTSTAFTTATLNSTYPNAISADRIVCPNIGSGMIYTKTSVGWLQSVETLMP